ncbi:HECT E3 ubiquitin ligase [Achlya hypogyna]|uniref:HECT E3 ubiquitin ligase n=1 Tax=Achlya hypogyna TaxID=1202772 RepID=A0A1V9ZEJ2_ACHHY|nr:HECT E3 ubiquitin ligase [Achlya hypogyna]
MSVDDTQWVRTSFADLRDESVLMELYGAAQRGNPAAGTTPDDTPVAVTSTSANGITMSWDEVHQDADVARLLLFASKHSLGSDGSQSKAKKSGRFKGTRGGITSLVLHESSLLGECPEAKASAKRQAKKDALFARMLEAYGKCVNAKESEATTAKVNGSSSASNAIAEPRTQSELEGLALKLFSLASVRMQVTIMKALGPAVQQECLRDIVGAIVEFPSMALSYVRRSSPEDATLATLFAFASSALMDADEDVMDEAMLLLVALGIASGQIHFLLPVLDKLQQAPATFEVSPSCVAHFDALFQRLRAFEPSSTLGAYDDGVLLQYIRLKAETPMLPGAAVATDGAHVYLWSQAEGLFKIGTGSRGSVAGQIVAEAPAASYLDHLGARPHVVKAISGVFDIVTHLFERRPAPAATVRDVCGASTGRLLLFYTEGDTLVEQEFEPTDDVWLPPPGSLLRAIYGTFVDVTDTVVHASASSATVAFSDAIDPAQNAQLVLFSVAMPLQDHLTSTVVAKGDVLFHASPVESSSSIAVVRGRLFLGLSATGHELLELSLGDLSVQRCVALPEATLGTRLQLTTEGDYLYDVVGTAPTTLHVTTYDMEPGPKKLASMTLSLDQLPEVVAWAVSTVYTNGRMLCVVYPLGDDMKYAFFSLRDGTLAGVQTGPVRPSPPVVAFDAAANALWSYHATRHCIEACQNTGPVVSLRAPVAAPAETSVASAPGLKWLLELLRTIHATASPLVHPEAKIDPALVCVPFAVDVRLETFQTLVSHVLSYGGRFVAGTALAAWEEALLLTSLVALTANVLHLHSTADAVIVDWVVRSPLSKHLSVLTRHPNSDHAVVQAALRLYIASLDVFYAPPLAQLDIALDFLTREHKRALQPSERPILQLLLQRLAALSKVKDIVMQPQAPDHLETLLGAATALFDRDDSSRAIATEVVSFVYAVMQGVLWGAQAGRIEWSVAARAIVAIVQASVATTAVASALLADGIAWAALDARLEASVVGRVLPLLCTAMHAFLTTLQHDTTIYKEIATQLMELFVGVGALVTAAGVKDAVHDASCTSSVTKMLESAHDYQNNTHELTELRVPGAKRLTITFDAASRTETGYDYVTFYKDESQTLFYGQEKYSGRGDDANWPGTGGRPPLVIDADGCVVLFHTDGSGVDWGYKLTAVADVVEPTTCLSLHWIGHVEESIATVLAHVASALVRTKLFAPLSSKEVGHMPLLSSRLLQGGTHAELANEPVVAFLQTLIDPEGHVVAETAVAALKRHTVEDQGSIPHINRAVRAVAAAILHHNLWGNDVYQWAAAGATGLPSPAVLKAWRTAQKMRQWFDVGDASATTPLRPHGVAMPGLKRQPSAYKGASEEAIAALCGLVVDRAALLLTLTPASFAFVRAAKLRWGLLAKYKTALSRQHSWGHLVREVEAATELKSLLDYRRSSYERSHTALPKTVTELVLEFVQSDVFAADITEILTTRKDRAALRHLGLRIVGEALVATSSPRIQLLLLDGLGRSLRAMGSEDPCSTNVHFLNSLNGCDEAQRQAVSDSVLVVLKASAGILELCLQRSLDSVGAGLVTTLLRAIAMDYDVRDSFLLYESKVLPHLLRLLPSENVGIRRAAQSILRVFLSHFVAIDDLHEEEHPREDLSQFQKQLLAAVRLQLEGVVGVLERDKEQGATPLSRHLPGWCAPAVPVLANHSISCWVYVDESSCQYALKVGDEVRRGPHWSSDNDEDGGESGTGTIVAVLGPTLVSVNWYATKKVCTYVWNPPEFQVQLVDEGMGGMVFLHGNRNLVTDTEESAPWSHYGLFLTDDAQLKYVLGSGTEKDIVLESTERLHLHAWNHVCLVKDDAVLKLFLNGVLDSHHKLESDVLSPAVAPSATVIETAHPCDGHGALPVAMWPVAYPGAVSLVVTVDPLTQLDKANGDYLCFYKAGSTSECWGEPKYTSSFPGVHGHGPLVIPADAVTVAYHSTSSSVKWGLRLVVAAEYADAREAHAAVNPHPFYFGEPPPRVLDAPSSHCWLAAFNVFNVALRDHEVQLLMRVTPQDSTPTSFPIDRALHTLGLVKTCADTNFGRSFITTPALVRHLLVLATLGPLETRCGALHVLMELTPTLSPDLVADEFAEAFPGTTSFILSLLDGIGGVLAVHNAPRPSVRCTQTLSLLPSALSAMGLVDAQIALVRALGRTRDWATAVFSLLVESMNRLGSDRDAIDDTTAMGRAVAAIAVLGGVHDGVVIGSRVRCCVNIDGKESIEAGSVVQFNLKGEARMASVLFDCDNSRPVDVPIGDIATELEVGADIPLLFQYAGAYVQPLVDAIASFLKQPPVAAPQTVYLPRRALHEKREVIESEHPYGNDADETYTLDFPGATTISVTFDPLSSTEADCDYVRFLKADGSGYYGDDKYSGQHFPGVGALAPLVIPASSLHVLFHSDSTNNDWGFRFTATATIEQEMLPPEVPPTRAYLAWTDLRARCLRALQTCTQAFVPAFSPSLLSELTHIAVTPFEGRPMVSMPKSQVFESKHPYANSISEYMAVTFKGASELTISFDAASRTEDGCDYVVFFKDKSLTERWGHHQYTGRAGTENWPGCGGRPPLVIPAEGFTLLWCTDSSNVDWGWKFVVKATFPSLTTLALSPEGLNQRSYHVQEVMYERMQPPPLPPTGAFDGFEIALTPVLRTHRYLSNREPNVPPGPSSPATDLSWFRVAAFENVAMHTTHADDAEVVDVLTHNSIVRVVGEHSEWRLVETSSGDRGWCKSRRGDIWLLRPAAQSLAYVDEDTVVLGVDDVHPAASPDVDDSNEEQEELADFTSHFTLEEVKGQSLRLHTLAVETAQASAIQSARACLLALVQQPRFDMTLEMFGSPTALLEFIVVVLATAPPVAVTDGLRRRLGELIHGPDGLRLLDGVVGYASHVLRTARDSQPKGRAIVRHLESSHPYSDNMDMYWKVELPGARRIKVVFDPRSKTEAGCDYLCFYSATDRAVTYGDTQYTGRGGAENWPGTGGRPPLLIDADRFEVYFHSDGSGNDWGFAFTAYGILADDDDDSAGQAATDSQVETATWLLQSITALPNKTPEMLDTVYAPHVLASWHEALLSMPQSVKLAMLGMLTHLALDHVAWKHVARQRVALVKLVALVKKRLFALYRSEERQDVRSIYLQGLLQCALALDHALETCGFTSAPSLPPPTPTVLRGAQSDCIAYCDGIELPSGYVHTVVMEVQECHQAIALGVTNATRSWSAMWLSAPGAAMDLKGLNAAAGLVVGYTQGDTMTLEVDLTRFEIVLRKNKSRVTEIAVPPDVGELVPVVVFGANDDTVVVVVVPSLPVVPDFPDPFWYTKLMESKAALLLETATAPAAVVLESPHPMPDDVVKETITIPGATKLEVRFDRRTQMGSQDTHELTTASQSIVLTGLDGQRNAADGAFGPFEVAPKVVLQPGDIVVRSDDWVYGDEDGGPGTYGEVKELTGWKHRPGMGVTVRWHKSGTENTYRYGYNGHFDVMLAAARPRPVLWLDGDTVTIAVRPYQAAAHADHDFKGSLDFNQETAVAVPVTPTLLLRNDFTLQWWLRLGDVTKNETRRPQTIFFAGGTSADSCLHVSATHDLKLRVLFKSHDFLDSMLSDALLPNAWTQLSLIGSGSDVVLYKNGEKWVQHTFYGRTEYTTPWQLLHMGSSEAATRLGFKQYNGLLGQLYDVKLWDAPLTPADLRREYLDKGVLPLPSMFLPTAGHTLNWTTINKTGRDRRCVKSSVSVTRGRAYYEVTLLSGGSVVIGWASPAYIPHGKTATLGDDPHAYGLDVHRQYMWHDGPLPFTNPVDVKAKAGDVIGCLLDCDRGVMAFTLNGARIGDTFGAPPMAPTPPPATTSSFRVAPVLTTTPRSLGVYEAKVAELLEMGCSRQKAIEALERNRQDVARALEWLLHNPDMTVAPPGPHVRLIEEALPSANLWQNQGGLSPAVSLSPLGAQGVSWNLGQEPFVHLPPGYDAVLPMGDAASSHAFVVYDGAEDGWEPIQVRHKLQDLVPRLLHRWQLSEGAGTVVSDAVAPTTGQLRTTPGARPWKAWLYSPLFQQTLGAWGYKLTVFGHFHPNSRSRTRFLCGAVPAYPRPVAQNMQLVEFVNAQVQARQFDTSQSLRVAWADIAPHEDELVRWPLLCEIAYGTSSAPTPAIDGADTTYANHDRLAARFKALQDFNVAMHRLLPWVHFAPDAPAGSLANLVAACRGLIFNRLKKTLWEAALKRSARPGPPLDLTLNRPKAMRQRATGAPDEDARSALFAQAFRQLNATENYHFRRSENVYYVKFLGENAEDAGGPYRETLCQYAAELQSGQLPLLLRTPNAVHNVGAFREKWVFNPTAFGTQSRLRRRLLEFLGKLLGAAVRSRDYLALDLASLMWKWLVHEPRRVADLEAIDSMLVQSMAKIRTIDTLGVTEAMFEDIVLETFTTLSTDNRMVEIRPGGSREAVTFANRGDFADLVEHYRLHEFDCVLADVEAGLGKVVPLRLLRLFTAHELERMVCGSPDVDVDLLQQCTEYSSCAATDQHIMWFWQVLRRFSHDERSAFLRFVWGRSRLPAVAAEFPQWFKLQSFSKTPPDAYLPVAHTCFFALELPPYSSEELLAKKLLYSIYNCQEIDADGDSVAANQLGWEE